ncbi:MAG TPA: ATP-binding protein, partial [Blastocatellia bacterium]|nr:ATP-binding protein [Blastocatellia bacterium]
NRLKDEFLATVSHELRTPLNAILGWAGMVRSGKLDSDTVARGLEAIERNAKSQTQIIGDLLDVSRIITGKLRLEVQPVELAPVIEAAVDTVRPAVDAKSIRLQLVLNPETGPVLGDPDRLQQIIWNLLSNAVRFTPREGRIQISLERVNSHVEITVSDTGKGIIPDFLPFVFDRFRQADSSFTRAHGGLGLGLSIVRHLVELHGGTVSAHSDGEGKGSTFVVQLPLMIAHDSGRLAGKSIEWDAPSVELSKAFDRSPSLEGLRVLVVDDDADARELLSVILGQCGALVTPVGSVAEALDEIEKVRPNILLSDIEMPDEDGYLLIRRLREREQKNGFRIPAAALTAHARVEDRMRALSAGFDTHVAKPVEPVELITVIASLARRTAQL